MEMKKIDEFIEKHKILPRDCEYHTNRDITGKSGKKGKLRVLAWKKDNMARVEYVCPECLKYGYQETEWKRPFSIKCEHCGIKIAVPKMKEQFKREMKQAKAKAKKK
jgi:DNA-directed RNA polymerase subunit RPC12/RpoP